MHRRRAARRQAHADLLHHQPAGLRDRRAGRRRIRGRGVSPGRAHLPEGVAGPGRRLIDPGDRPGATTGPGARARGTGDALRPRRSDLYGRVALAYGAHLLGLSHRRIGALFPAARHCQLLVGERARLRRRYRAIRYTARLLDPVRRDGRDCSIHRPPALYDLRGSASHRRRRVCVRKRARADPTAGHPGDVCRMSRLVGSPGALPARRRSDSPLVLRFRRFDERGRRTGAGDADRPVSADAGAGFYVWRVVCWLADLQAQTDAGRRCGSH